MPIKFKLRNPQTLAFYRNKKSKLKNVNLSKFKKIFFFDLNHCKKKFSERNAKF